MRNWAVFLGLVALVAANTEVEGLYWEEDSADTPTGVDGVLFRGQGGVFSVDFHLNSYQRPQEGQKHSVLVAIGNSDTAQMPLRVCWSAIHPVDVSVRQKDHNVVEIALQSNAYSLKDQDFQAQVLVDTLEYAELVTLGSYVLLTALVAVLASTALTIAL